MLNSVAERARVLAPANENEERHGRVLIDGTRRILLRTEARLGSLIGDCQYSSSKMRSLVENTVIPYMANQRRGGAC